jgi:hypothetical protein
MDGNALRKGLKTKSPWLGGDLHPGAEHPSIDAYDASAQAVGRSWAA